MKLSYVRETSRDFGNFGFSRRSYAFRRLLHFLSHPARQSDRDAVKRFSNFDDPPEMAPAPYDFVRYISREIYDSGPVTTTVRRELFETRSSDTAMHFTELTITPTIPTYYPFQCFWAAGGYRKHAMASSCMNAKWSQQHHGVQVGFPHGRLQLCSPMKRRRLQTFVWPMRRFCSI
ncbi:hypothetical protein BGW80DRAFT_518414 [Lactifluus volemus]|nr:hypothetical protein BGW80DRAFT_518414 [Lactifluus volemus]